MKKHFTKYLTEDLGFKPFRRTCNGFVENNINDFSTLQEGGLHVVYIKDDLKIWWGLNEQSKPPTLCYPRPNIMLKIADCSFGNQFDDAMNICLKEESNEDIFKALFDKTIFFKYDKTRNY